MKRIRIILLITCIFALLNTIHGQTERLDSIRVRLERVARLDSVYLSGIDISVGQLPLGELFRTIAKVNGVNICYKVNENLSVTCNFKRTRVIDLLFFLCKEYQLDLETSGNIISITTPPSPAPVEKEPQITFDPSRGLLSYDLLNDRLIRVVKLITSLTGEKIILPRELYDQRVSGYLLHATPKDAIPTLASINHLEIEHDQKGHWRLSAPEQEGNKGGINSSLYTRRRTFSPDEIAIDSLGHVTVIVNRGKIHDIVQELCHQLGINRVFLSPLEQETSLHVQQTDLSTLLDVLFTGTPYTYRVENGVYLFGNSTKNKELVSTRVIPLRHRSVDKIIEYIPAPMKEGIHVQVFPDLNSVILSGVEGKMQEIERFLKSIDQPVPLVTIEVLIVDSRKSVIHEVGLTAGLGEEPTRTTGTLSPGINMNLSATSINKLINSFNGFGSINLGKVTPSFYMNLQALEEAGYIELRSTPKLSTLNGHEASLSSGETKYYKEVQTNYYGSQTPVPSESYTWKEINADLSLKIIPFVSQQGIITLSIEIEQSEFTQREDKDAPPGLTTRNFKSLVQVHNEEMVLLGGIDRNSKEKSSKGLPFIARIPILKWIFGSTTNNKVDEKLNVFIKPTVIY